MCCLRSAVCSAEHLRSHSASAAFLLWPRVRLKLSAACVAGCGLWLFACPLHAADVHWATANCACSSFAYIEPQAVATSECGNDALPLLVSLWLCIACRLSFSVRYTLSCFSAAGYRYHLRQFVVHSASGCWLLACPLVSPMALQAPVSSIICCSCCASPTACCARFNGIMGQAVLLLHMCMYSWPCCAAPHFTMWRP